LCKGGKNINTDKKIKLHNNFEKENIFEDN
jgi:hypothetical protein